MASSMSLESKVFAVTGGGSGMGAATCRLLAQRGARAVCAGDISSNGFAALKEAVAHINPKTELRCAISDVTSRQGVEDWIKDIIDEFSDLHGAANIAGLPQVMGARGIPAILEETDEDWARIINVNLNGVFLCTRAQIRAMKDLTPSDRGIVNLASIASMGHNPDVYAYRTSKRACAHFSESVAKDVFRMGIRVNVVSPGQTETPMLAAFMGDNADAMKKVWKERGWDPISADDVARVIVWLLSEDAKAVYGANINVGAGIP